MADQDIKTTLSLDLKLRNKQEIAAFEKAMKNVSKSVSEMMSDKSAAKFLSTLVKSREAMEELADASTGFYEDRIKGEKALAEQQRKNDEHADRRQEAMEKRREARKNYFLKGAIQGMGGPMFLSGRAPIRQSMGYMLGSAIQAGGRVLGGGVRSLFTGASGVGQMLSALPGGSVAGPVFSAGMGAAEDALGYGRSFQNFMDQGATFRNRRMSLDELKAFTQTAGAQRIMDRARREANAPIFEEGGPGFRGARDLDRFVPGQAMGGMRRRDRTSAERNEIFETAIGERDALERRFERGLSAMDFEKSVKLMAEQVGLALPAALGIAGRSANVAGGMRDDPTSMATIQAALSASRFGVGAETVGQFGMLARRRGQGDPGALVNESMARAFEMGLRGAEVPALLDTIASEISTIRKSGGEISLAGRFNSGLAFSQLGLNPEAAANAAGGLAATGRRIGAGNIQGMDWMFLRQLGGLRGGGPLSGEDLLNAKLRAERGDFSSSDVTGMFRSALQRGGGNNAYGIQYAQAELASYGVNLQTSAVKRMAETLRSGGTDAQLAAQLETSAKLGADFRSEGLYTKAIGMTNDQLVRSAEQENERLRVGRELIDSSQDLVQAQTNALTTLAAFAENIRGVTSAIGDLSRAVNNAIGAFGSQSAMSQVSEVP